MNTKFERLFVDQLANEIRRVDGSHSLGAGALAEALMPLITAQHPASMAVREWTPSGEDYDRSIHSNPDAKAWADHFVATFPGLADHHSAMVGWFANAMMAMHDHIKQTSPPGCAGELAKIGELIRTQDNRITDQPIFIVQQRSRIYGLDDGHAEGHVWHYDGAESSYDDAAKAERDAERAEDGSPPLEWEQVGYIETWEFVTACFTEQGCKDYIAINGHNLREPRIYAEGSFRNTEWHQVRNFLIGAGLCASAKADSWLGIDSARSLPLDMTGCSGPCAVLLPISMTRPGPFIRQGRYDLAVGDFVCDTTRQVLRDAVAFMVPIFPVAASPAALGQGS